MDSPTSAFSVPRTNEPLTATSPCSSDWAPLITQPWICSASTGATASAHRIARLTIGMSKRSPVPEMPDSVTSFCTRPKRSFAWLAKATASSGSGATRTIVVATVRRSEVKAQRPPRRRPSACREGKSSSASSMDQRMASTNGPQDQEQRAGQQRRRHQREHARIEAVVAGGHRRDRSCRSESRVEQPGQWHQERGQPDVRPVGDEGRGRIRLDRSATGSAPRAARAPPRSGG